MVEGTQRESYLICRSKQLLKKVNKALDKAFSDNVNLLLQWWHLETYDHEFKNCQKHVLHVEVL